MKFLQEFGTKHLLLLMFPVFFILVFVLSTKGVRAQTFDVSYEGDVVPTEATPSWSPVCNEAVCLPETPAVTSGGILTITDDTINDFLAFGRSDNSFSSTNNILVDFRMRIVSTDPGTGPDKTVVMGIQDGRTNCSSLLAFADNLVRRFGRYSCTF